MSVAKSFLRFDLLMFLIILFVPLAFFQQHALIIILTTFLVIFSRATSLYDHLKIEFHSVLTLVIAFLYGPLAGVFIAIASAPMVNMAGKLLGSFQKPPWIILDSVYLVILSYIASFIPEAKLFDYGLLTIILFGNGLVGFARVYAFNDPLSRRIPLSVINIIFNYLLLKNFLPQIINFLR